MLEYESEIIGQKPQNLVIFLHGYNGTIDDHAYALEWLKQSLENSWLYIPSAPEISEKNPAKKQWFGMIKYDENNSRCQADTTTDEIIKIYNRTQNDVSARADEINDFIGEMQQRHNVAEENTYIIGFSQGAMLALFCALSDKKVKGGAFMLSGLVAGEKLLAQKIANRPHIYMFHGKNDNKVQYKTLAFSDEWLTKNGVNHSVFTYPDLAHKMCEAEIKQICEIINKKQPKTK